MTRDDFVTVRHFTPDEWQPIEGLSPALVHAVDDWRDWHGVETIIHDAVDLVGHVNGTEHATGLAVDLHLVGLSVWDQWLLAERWPAFRGIGVYPFTRSVLYPAGWVHPGLHVDIRDTAARARWYRDGTGQYLALDGAALARLVA